jgi:hypothetical protein
MSRLLVTCNTLVQCFVAGSPIDERIYSVERERLSPIHSHVLITARKLSFV